MRAVHAEDLPALRNSFEEQVKGRSTRVVFRITRPDGSIRWVQNRAFPVTNDEGAVVRVAGVAEDVTERKQAEEALRQSEERFSKAFHASPVAASITTFAEGRFLDVNDRVLRVTGFSREEVIGHTSIELRMWGPASRAEVVQYALRQGWLGEANKPLNPPAL
jgi:PAS domain-containing protein